MPTATRLPMTVKHKRRGTTYEVVGDASVQASMPIHEGDHIVVYRGQDGALWARPYKEFHDGRFEPVTE